VNYYIKKVSSSIKDKTLKLKALIYIRNLCWVPIEVFWGFFIFYKGITNTKISKNLKIKINNNEVINRILSAYKLSKNNSTNIYNYFKIKGVWNEWIEINFKYLIKALKDENIIILNNLLNNMFEESFTRGLGIFEGYTKSKNLFGKFYFKYVWNSYLKHYLLLGGKKEELIFPNVGNPTGIKIKNKIIPYEAIRHSYLAKQYSELLRDQKNPLIVEIGGGFGGFAYQLISLIKNKNTRYIIYDLPEVNAISSFFLMNAFPDKKVILFGEEEIWKSKNLEFDIAIMPYYMISKLPKDSSDLIYNACSFSEMSRECALGYIKQIEVSCKKYFAHENHETRFRYYDKNDFSTNLIGSEVILNKNKFKRIFKKPRLQIPPEDKFFGYFEYLYERIDR
tara:strand:+ start:3587 stop:4768 length:1182 start_codon:yes stop_codon:yes gene_type:complete